MSTTARELLGRIEAIDTASADTRHRTESYQRMAGELALVEGRACSPDGVVAVVATSGGALTSITFSDAVRSISPAALSAIVLHTVAAARATAARQQAEVIRRGLGDTELLDRVLAADERLFGDQRPVDPAPIQLPAVTRRPKPVDEPSFEHRDLLVGEDY